MARAVRIAARGLVYQCREALDVVCLRSTEQSTDAAVSKIRHKLPNGTLGAETFAPSRKRRAARQAARRRPTRREGMPLPEAAMYGAPRRMLDVLKQVRDA